MKTLVTGSSGLIGSEVSIFFARQGCSIHGVDNNQRAAFFGPQKRGVILERGQSRVLTQFKKNEKFGVWQDNCELNTQGRFTMW